MSVSDSASHLQTYTEKILLFKRIATIFLSFNAMGRPVFSTLVGTLVGTLLQGVLIACPVACNYASCADFGPLFRACVPALLRMLGSESGPLCPTSQIRRHQQASCIPATSGIRRSRAFIATQQELDIPCMDW